MDRVALSVSGSRVHAQLDLRWLNLAARGHSQAAASASGKIDPFRCIAATGTVAAGQCAGEQNDAAVWLPSKHGGLPPSQTLGAWRAFDLH